MNTAVTDMVVRPGFACRNGVVLMPEMRLVHLVREDVTGRVAGVRSVDSTLEPGSEDADDGHGCDVSPHTEMVIDRSGNFKAVVGSLRRRANAPDQNFRRTVAPYC